MNVLFTALRVLTVLASAAALALIGLIVFLREAAATVKQGARVLGYVVRLFASAFTEGTAPRDPGGQAGWWPVMIGVLALLMMVSVVTPGARWFLHGIAAFSAIVMAGYARMIFTGPGWELVCLPFLLVWYAYYAMCLCSVGSMPSAAPPVP